MWLFKSSIGRKFVMAVTGVCLVLFVTFHVLMNSVALIWPTAYNQVCEFLGANWYALIASAGLGLLFIIHIVYAVWLTLQNRAARGNDRYAVTSRPPQVEWSSKNMLVLGIVILAFLAVHLVQFWAKMQWQELRHADLSVLPQLDGVPCGPAQGTLFLQLAFQNIWTPIVYIIGFIALWFHMTHGFWSMFQTVGWDNARWLNRLKCIANWWTSIVIALFVAQAVVFTVHAHNDYYTENEALQQQYAEYWNEQAKDLVQNFLEPLNAQVAPVMASAENGDMVAQMKAQQDIMAIQTKYISANGPKFVENAQAVLDAFKKQCPKVTPGEEISRLGQFRAQIISMLPQSMPSQPQGADAAAADAAQTQPEAQPEAQPQN